MENRLSVKKGTITKQSKQSYKKIKPIKVVYISNPMKVKTSVSEFRSLVQELTGRDSDLSDRTRFSDTTDEIDGFQAVPDDDHQNMNKVLSNNDNHGILQEVLGVDPYWNSSSSDLPIFGPFDDIFVPQMVDNFNGFLPNSSLFYEAPHLVDFIQKP
ncbi:VQ [Macleaya cordata]|uniref:VQ n=1 Tax=Macleaya cordata TaxID=56857 RepID=A0A200Q5I5_MACCD|nr:VQ [Macleaya cordata]